MEKKAFSAYLLWRNVFYGFKIRYRSTIKIYLKWPKNV
jgi:hypothetical protein